MARNIYLTSPLKKEGTIHLPMISFRIIKREIDFGDCDTLMFTSKQAVASADEIDPSWRGYPSIAIGGATAAEIEKRGGTVLHTPDDFYGESLAEDVARLFRDRRVLYLRPKKISFDSRTYLASKGIDLREDIIYETSCRRYERSDAPSPGSIVIFTSPSTIHCFLDNFGWSDTYTAVVIGRATLEHLPPGSDYIVSDIPRIDACVDAAKKHSANNFD